MLRIPSFRKASLRASHLILTLALGASVASASVIYVNQNAPGNAHDGKAWATAFLTIREGLNAAASGDDVWVAKGTYNEAISIGKPTGLFGGFAGTEIERSQRDRSANPTVAARASIYNAPGSILDGFTIRQSTYGVGVHYGTATLSNNVLCDNTEEGVFAFLATVTLINNIISNNQTAVTVVAGAATLISNTITLNHGYGVFATGSPVTMTNNIFSGNNQAVSTSDGTVVAANNLIYGNTAGMAVSTDTGAGAGRIVTLTNNTISGNQWGIFCTGQTGSVILTNNIVSGNTINGVSTSSQAKVQVRLSHNDVYGNATNFYLVADPGRTSGNISEDPLFVDRAGGDYRIIPDSPCANTGDDSVVMPGSTDLNGKARIRGAHVDIGAYETTPPVPLTLSLGASLTAAPALFQDVVYAATSDGKLHARSLTNGSTVPGFPLDLNAALGRSVTFNSRPAVYAGATGLAVYLTTSDGQVVKVSPQGKVLWQQKPFNGFTMSTPAVTPDGRVLVSLGYQGTPPEAQNFLFALDETTGRPLSLSPYLGSSTPESSIDRSPAAFGRYVYLNATGITYGGLVVLNRDNLTVRAQFAPGEDALPPYITGPSLFVATKAGKIYKRNAVTFTPVEGFGQYGSVSLGEEVTAAPFADATGRVNVGTAKGRVYVLDPETGAKRLMHDSGTGQPVSGLVVLRASSVLAYASGDRFITLPVSDATKAQAQKLDGAIVGGLVYDVATGRFVLATAPGSIHAIPVL